MSPDSAVETPKTEKHQTSKQPAEGGTPPAEPTTAPSGNQRIGRLVALGAIASVVALAAVYVIATLPRAAQRKRLDEEARRAVDSPPRVSVTKARREAGSTERVLPGNAQAYRETGLYARTTGYLKEWRADIGDKVTAGQLIATIDAPDLDDQLAQAEANLEQARATLRLNEANAALAEKTMARYLALEKQNVGAVAQLQIDEQQATVLTSNESVKAAQSSIGVNVATVRMYQDLQKFEKIIAPYAGVITARNVDPGTLVTADNPSATRELFHLMQIDPLRVFVDVPQTYATEIKGGESANVYRPEDPGRLFHGKVSRTANALDPNTRTLLTQIDVPNPEGALRPGMYLMVKFIAERQAPSVIVPSAALVVAANGKINVPVVDAENKVRYRHVELGRDDGTNVEIVAGLSGTETVAVHPGDALADGATIEPVPAKQYSNTPGKASQPAEAPNAQSPDAKTMSPVKADTSDTQTAPGGSKQ
jgi:membrane fusion protein, multidrug efflux system